MNEHELFLAVGLKLLTIWGLPFGVYGWCTYLYMNWPGRNK